MSWVRIPLVTPKKSSVVERLLRIFLLYPFPSELHALGDFEGGDNVQDFLPKFLFVHS